MNNNSSSSSSPAWKRVKSYHRDIVDLTSPGEWSCRRCTLLNSDEMERCQLCDQQRNESGIIAKLASLPQPPPIAKTPSSITAKDYYVDGVLPLLQKRNPSTPIKTMMICSAAPFHFTQLFQEGKYWSCGYRNIQILCSACMRDEVLYEVLCGGKGEIPSIQGIQRVLELAWQQGFDEEGGRHFGFQLVGKKKWIGATECVVFFRYFGIETEVVDFLPDDPNSPKPSQVLEVRRKIEHFLNSYFSDDESPANIKFPLYFQQSGHSRTIIGIEKTMNGTGTLSMQNLLVFDPAIDGRTIRATLNDETTLRWRSSLCRSLETLKDVKYQIVCLRPRVMSEEEKQRSKILRGILYTLK